MKLSTRDASELFGTAAPRVDTTTSDLLHLLVASTPKLWKHCREVGPSKADQRRKFLELLDWFAGRHEATVKRRHPATYKARDGSDVRGSVDAVISPRVGGPGVAVELDFSADINSAYKLLDLRRQAGHGCLLVSAYGHSAEEVRARVDQGFRKPTFPWLALVHVA